MNMLLILIVLSLFFNECLSLEACSADTCPSPDQDSSSIIPIIDISALFSDNKQEKKMLASKIGKACEEIGFFVITNHGIDSEVVNSIWESTYKFFDLPTEEKLTFSPESQEGKRYLLQDIIALPILFPFK